jgi:DNA-binding XRE family transcriptional regulator
MKDIITKLIAYQHSQNLGNTELARRVGISVPTYLKLKNDGNPHKNTEILIENFLNDPKIDELTARRNKLIEYQTAKGLTNEQLAVEIGLTRQTIDNIFKARSNANISTWKIIDNFLERIISM